MGGSIHMKVALLCLFILAAACNVWACAVNRQKLRAAAKALLMPLLAAIYLLQAKEPNALVLTALGFGWLGDLFLIDPNRIVLRMSGVAAFLIGHGFYLAAMITHFAPEPQLWMWFPGIGVPVAAAAVLYFLVSPVMPREMKLPGAGYFLALAAVNAVSALVLLSGCAGGTALMAGFALFLASDTVLCRQFFTVGHPAPKHDVAVMTTYILAQSCIILAFVI